MARALSSAPKPAYEKFLFATVGQDGKGVELSVLSILARADLDPWEEASSLAFLPREMAANRLLRTIIGLPEVPPDQATFENAHRLVGLLPSIVHPEVAGIALTSEKNIRLMAWAFTLIVVVIVTIIFQWIYAERVAASRASSDRMPHLISAPRQPTKSEH